jgi:iron complex transport system ATP-binding protein
MLQINNLRCGYKDKFHISDIHFHVKSGGYTGIIGPNGSGKTTFFRGITGELKAESGNIILNGRDIETMTHKEKARNMAFVTQELDEPGITVEDYVLMGRIPYHRPFQFFESREDYRIAHKYLQLTHISHLKDKYMYQISGGERQLAAIARALTQEPKLLLLDEPTSHLDIMHQVQILNLVQRLNSQLELTVLMIMHDLNLAGEYCDHLIMLNNGTIHISGKPEEVLNYKTIENVYKTVVVTRTNPISGKPVIFLVSEKVLSNRHHPNH